MAAAHTTADTATGGRRGAAAVEASTTATAENSTAAMAVAAAAAAKVEDTAADSKSGLRAWKVASGRRYTPSLISIYKGYLFLSNFIPQLFSFCLLLFQKNNILKIPMFKETWKNKVAILLVFLKYFLLASLLLEE
jgi:hypothetical protein